MSETIKQIAERFKLSPQQVASLFLRLGKFYTIDSTVEDELVTLLEPELRVARPVVKKKKYFRTTRTKVRLNAHE